MGLSFQVEPLTGILAGEIEVLAKLDTDETSNFLDIKGPMDIDWAYLFARAAAGFLECITARDGARLAGYFGYEYGFLANHKTVSQVKDIAIYLLPEYRRGLVGFRFIAYCVARMEQAPAKIIRVVNMANHDFAPLWRRLGFLPEEIHYTKINPKHRGGDA